MTADVVFHPRAVEDLESLEAFIAKDSAVRAAAFLAGLQPFCESLSTFPKRGVARDDLAAGVRMLVFERRVIVLYRVDARTVLILRLVYAGRNLEDLWSDDRSKAD